MSSMRERVVRLLKRRWFMWLFFLVAAVLACWLCRVPLLQAAIGHLMMEEDVTPVDAVYVLGGAAMERGSRAAQVHHQLPNAPFYFTGSTISKELEAYGVRIDESEMSRDIARSNGLPLDKCIPLHLGTSTMEEADAILIHARMMAYDTIAILSSRYHLRRIDYVFTERFAEKGIIVRRFGAPTDRFDERFWWRSEDGLLAVQNEFVKLVFYWWKY